MAVYIIIALTVAISLFCFKNRAAFYALSMSPYNVAHKNQFYRIVTHAFVHGNMSHLLINMLVFWSFGRVVLSVFQAIFGIHYLYHFLALYFGAVVASGIYDLAKFKNNYYYNSIGASAAVTATVFASILFSPWSKIYFFAVVPIPAILFGVCYLWYESYLSKKGGDGVNHLAHIIGAAWGFLYPIAIEPRLLSGFISQILSILQ